MGYCVRLRAFERVRATLCVYLIVRLSVPSPPSKIKGASGSVPSIQGVRVGLRVGEPSTLCARLGG